ncbi:MAG: hypothetical protein R3F34_13270 [Planctomycetota bacterium]
MTTIRPESSDSARARIVGAFSPVVRAGLVAALFAAPLFAQSRYATQVVNFTPGPFTGPPFDDPLHALGGPTGGGLLTGSLDVVTLGIGGSLTLGFDRTITDGPGADFTVFENAIGVQSEAYLTVYSEVVFVEVSTNGVDWARFPVDYEGPNATTGQYNGMRWGTYARMAGDVPTASNVLTNGIDPFDPVVSGGNAFDLRDLEQDPAVVAGKVNLRRIHFVRLVDCENGMWVDVEGETIWDNGGLTGSADIDAVAVLNDTQIVNPHQPETDLWKDFLGHVHLSFSDPDGLWNLDPVTAAFSYNLNYVSIPDLLYFGIFRIEAITPNGIELKTPFTAQELGYTSVFAASVTDLAGNRSVDQIAVQP